MAQRLGELVGRRAQREDEPLAGIDRVIPRPLRADAAAWRHAAHVFDELTAGERVRDRGRVTEAVRDRATWKRQESTDAPDAQQRELLDHLGVER